jgi:addiction module HigA family antidote
MNANPMLRGLKPMHPGELLREVALPALGRKKKEIAALLGVSRQMLYEMLAERAPITPATALRLGKLCGNGAETWLDLQRTFDLATEEKRLSAEIKKIPTLKAADEAACAKSSPPLSCTFISTESRSCATPYISPS